MKTDEARSHEKKILEAIETKSAAGLFIKGKDLAKMLNLADAKCIHPYIRNLRKSGELIAAVSEGYYMAELKEYKEYIKKSYKNRAFAILVNARDALREVNEKYSKQLQLDLDFDEIMKEITESLRD